MPVRAVVRGQGPIRAVLAAAAVLTASACARAQAAAAPETGGCARHQAEFPRLTGLTEAAAVAAVEGMPGIRTLRIGGPNTPMTRDYRPDRATLLLRDGKVERVLCG